VLTALGRRLEAEEALARFLDKFPDDTQALALQQSLERVRDTRRLPASEPKKR
jgi:regulator of sirC expression with transglutaminase-like and TPR domain